MSLKFHFARVAFLLFIGAGPLSGQTISDFNPKLGTTNDQILISGSGFATGPIKIYFWNGKIAVTNITSDSQLYAIVPSGVITGPIGVQRGSGTTNFSASDFTVIGRGPFITDFSPSYGDTSTLVTINGVHFTNLLSVKFNGTAAVSPNVNADGTQITAFVPANASNGLISVTTSFGSFTNANTFTAVGAGPYIANFSPATGNVNDTVNLNGMHFGSTTAVRFNGVAASFDPPATDTALTAHVPSGAMTGAITVMNPSGSYSTTSNFFIQPQVTGLSPANGRSGTNVIITGKSFTGITNVTFNGLNAASFNINTSTQITAVVPINAATGPVRVYAPLAGPNPPSSTFTVQPTIFGFSPGFGPVATSVTITGANFNVSGLAVKFNGVAANPPTGVTFGQLTAVVPSGATTGPVTVSTSDGTNTSSRNFYLPASITSFAPASSLPGTTVVITGVNFIDATSVAFNGTAASFNVTNNTTIGAIVPVGVTTGPVSVTTPAGTTNSSSLFYVLPVINSFNPTHGLPGDSVTIAGANFQGTTDVQFNGVAGGIVSVVSTQIVATVPVGAQTGLISVTAPAGTAYSSSNFVLDYQSNLKLTLTAAPDPVFVGSNLLYTLFITNAGPQDALATMLTNTLPTNVVIKSVTNFSGTVTTSNNVLIGNLGTVFAANTAVILVTVVPQSPGTLTNTASVRSQYVDPDLSDNDAILTTTVLPAPLLTILRQSPTRVRVYWPVMLTNYSLEYKNAFDDPNWSNDFTATTISGDQKYVTETNSGSGRFYRLKQ